MYILHPPFHSLKLAQSIVKHPGGTYDMNVGNDIFLPHRILDLGHSLLMQSSFPHCCVGTTCHFRQWQHGPGARHCAECLTCVLSFNPHDSGEIVSYSHLFPASTCKAPRVSTASRVKQDFKPGSLTEYLHCLKALLPPSACGQASSTH